MKPVAHSAPKKGLAPQDYSEHAHNCESLAQFFGGQVQQYSSSCTGWRDWQSSIDAGAEWHDLGKLDPENQEALRKGRGTSLPIDHVDAGVASLLASEPHREGAAWLVRAHHAPGLPSRLTENARGDFHLRGERFAGDDDETNRPLFDRNNKQLSDLEELHRKVVRLSPQAPENQGTVNHGIAARLALSCLVDADHSDAARFDAHGKGQIEPPKVKKCRWQERLNHLQEYIAIQQRKNKADGERNAMRQELFDSCLVAGVEDSPMVSCEATVGLGKTTSVLAYLLRQAVAKDLRRIVIVAPFTAILQQTATKLADAILLAGEIAEDVILEHHHRADFSDPQLRAASLTWDSPIILTTAVQFFETLGSNHPGALRKLHRLPGSAIFIDETHACLPHDLWPQCFLWLEELAEKWCCPTALVSGSQIRYWENLWGLPTGKQPRFLPELTPETVRTYSESQEHLRCELCHEKTPLTCEKLVSKIQTNLNLRRSQLVIVNTVHSAAGLAKALSEKLDSGVSLLKKRRVLHLSTLLAPVHREAILGEIGARQEEGDSEAWVLVATSCVEAGVDLDFHDGFREDCSTSSLIQTSGRINRNGLFKNSCLTRIHLAEDPAFRPHPQFEVSRQVLEELFPYLSNGEETITAISTAAAQREIENSVRSNRTETLPRAELDHDYPEVADLCRVIKSDTFTVLIDPEIKANIKGAKSREILTHSVQIWGNRLEQLALEPILTQNGQELYFASEASYDPHFLGLGKAVLEVPRQDENLVL